MYPQIDPKETSIPKLHATIQHQESIISKQKQRISTLQKQNKRLQSKITKIEKLLEPIQEKVNALKDVNLQAESLIKRQFKKDANKGDKEEHQNTEV